MIKLYRIRTFGEKISDTFDFVRENFRPLLKYLTYLMLPLSLVQAFAQTNFMGGYMDFIEKMGKNVQQSSDVSQMLSWVGSMTLMVVVDYVAMMLLVAMVYAMMQHYEQRPQRLEGITGEELRPDVTRMLGRQFIVLITSIVVMALFGVFAVLMALIHIGMLAIVFLVLLAVTPLFALVTPIYLFERETGIVSAYTKSIRLGWKTWGGIVGVGLVLFVIVTIVGSIIETPWTIMLMVKNVLTAQGSETGFVSSFGYTAIQYLLGVISTYVGNLLMSLLYIGMAYQYGHACEKVDGVTVDRDIENFETL